MNKIYVVLGIKNKGSEIVRVFNKEEQAKDYCFKENLRIDNGEKMFYPHSFYTVNEYSVT